MNTTLEVLKGFGACPADCVELDHQNDPRLLRYVDLVRDAEQPMIDVVVEERTQALLYVVNVARLGGSPSKFDIADLRRKLAMRGDQAWLAVMRHGQLDIYATDLRPDPESSPVSFSVGVAASAGVLPRLAHGEELAPLSSIMLRNVLFGLMTDAGQELKDLGLSTDESIALTGRALFFRYLIGRRIIGDNHLQTISPSSLSLDACFSDIDSLVAVNEWLDRTFNGDLLKLPNKDYREYFGGLFQRTDRKIIRPLEAILGLDQSLTPGLSQTQLNWGDLDFDHVPIGLLSETYEELMYRFDAEARRDTSVYYTPTHIAEYMVEEAFHQLPSGASARVLDPACGAGVFLVACFRKLAELHFSETGKRPSRQVLRKILDQQLTGFDINAHARTLAALALYLTALELDPDPAPVETLTFNKLEGKVLVDVADPGSNPVVIQPMAGSLGEHVSTQYLSAFDLVIGNPPWTSLKSAYVAIDKIFTRRCRAVAAGRGLDEIAATYKNPDRVSDLPFVWGAMEWAKPNGRIALAIAGRWLFKMSPAGFAARSAIFQALSITGILNGASVRQSRVWPNVEQPFCLLFADNRQPTDGDQFVLVSPDDEPALTGKGRMRIDACDAVPVELGLVVRQPTAVKTLYRGGALDISVVQRIRERSDFTIGEYWTPERGLHRGQGYQVAKRSDDDSFLEGMAQLGARYAAHPFVVMIDTLPSYEPQGLQWPRDPKIYKAPLVLVREGYKARREQGRALFSVADLAYSESYYGFSASGHPDGDFLSKYLLVLMHSKLFEYWALMTSAKFGVERESLQLHDIEHFPFVDIESIDGKTRDMICHCADELFSNRPDWDFLDRTVAELYGLHRYDLEVVSDSLSTRSPFPIIKSRSCGPVTLEEMEQFEQRLRVELSRVLAVSGYSVYIQRLASSMQLPWKFISVSLSEHAVPTMPPSGWIEHADDLAVSRITIVDHKEPLLVVGLLDHYRYWTLTQARLLASDLLWQHGAMLEARAKR
ncbi:MULTISPECIES: class I SAM-dependent DNA methyltransferase [unclassified Pseudomonas]|uniref:HsdM family class I SAM-dependent methyltransferase n=1 Tax=unclassified Pseudomonas TaxID=196821 RepID=UPI000C886609|nr:MULTISPECIES: N-6 DNA methylase [unclassified Pseudomonas]PMZ73258.1 type I restriction endonuclease subunit M [Pseudomonas sp. GW247-3R2A]PMY73388.1 type I restriction endonuclease subunit M [Pseudomonas sp. MPR-R3A]PMY98068.1 type I restriction endonuclease subunit M [Pseudomonas sp. FW305-124]PNA92656.1 type I restriction endonuclease subunit M [Pseudomonas sp. FW300-E2]PNB03208.1 type I restriction endonuclease subunit M [Pseudomonas sp. MPR-AND1B]